MAEDASQSLIDLQVRLAWAHASPGPVDGRMGKNTRTAVEAFQRMQGLEVTGEADEKTRAALPKSDKPTLVDYEITKDDVDGPFVDKIPDEMEDMAKLDRLSYTSPRELLAEKFHRDPDLLQSLNEGKSFDRVRHYDSCRQSRRPQARHQSQTHQGRQERADRARL